MHLVKRTLHAPVFIYVIARILVESKAAFLEKKVSMVKSPSGPLVRATREAGP